MQLTIYDFFGPVKSWSFPDYKTARREFSRLRKNIKRRAGVCNTQDNKTRGAGPYNSFSWTDRRGRWCLTVHGELDAPFWTIKP